MFAEPTPIACARERRRTTNPRHGVTLSVDEQGLDSVWIMDRDEAPSGPLACLSNAVYPIDWGGLTKQKMRLTVKIRYAPADAGPPD